jgi:FixJ family two-component response regulator
MATCTQVQVAACPSAELWWAARRRKIAPVSTSTASLVIVVEDDEGMRQAIRRVLEAGGFVTEVFNDAEALLASGAAARAECLVLDIHLGGMSGIELHERLRSEGREIPTVFVTAHEDWGRRGLLLTGADTCLVKPFPAEMLIQAVTRTCGGPRASNA